MLRSLVGSEMCIRDSLQLARYEDGCCPGIYDAAVRTLQRITREDKPPAEALRAMASALIASPTLFHCFNAMLPAGVFLPEDVQPLLECKPSPPANGASGNKKRKKATETAWSAAAAAVDKELCGVISTRGVPCKQAKAVCPYHQKEMSDEAVLQ
eukprot:TRINITY_DN12365_c0_g1_i3.p1 TRINITY_DN12365_c0_g1~~TRINITY_DN12365_c0_g1_i3.p1  ORF type:complete len:155 (+),score=40.00 TRINITY_DN12365_c0_g1_i3:118-582(+)